MISTMYIGVFFITESPKSLPSSKKKTSVLSQFAENPLSFTRKISGIGITGKSEMLRREGLGDRGIPPLVPRKVSGNHATAANTSSVTYHSSLAANSKRSSIHGRVDWSSK